MDSISQLSDELLFKILSLLPTAKDVVATMVLSKRWQFLWMFVPGLVYDDSYGNPEYAKFSRFVDRSLFLHEAPVIETLHFKLGSTCGTGDIRLWIGAADKCSVRELIIEIDALSSDTCPVTLPKRLYTGGCRMLVTLILSNAILVDHVFSSVSFPSLKKLSLIYMKYPSEEFVTKLLSNCPVLVDLVVKRNYYDNVAIFNSLVPSLKSLVWYESWDIAVDESHGFVIDAPSLELLEMFDTTNEVFVSRSNMPKIVEANVALASVHPGEILGSITAAKHLCLCVKDAYPSGSIFCCL